MMMMWIRLSAIILTGATATACASGGGPGLPDTSNLAGTSCADLVTTAQKVESYESWAKAGTGLLSIVPGASAFTGAANQAITQVSLARGRIENAMNASGCSEADLAVVRVGTAAADAPDF